jgi:hypothetical protein
MNIHYCAVPLSSSNALLQRSIFITAPRHYPGPMPSYIDQYPLLCRTIIQFQCPVTPINIHYCIVPLSSSNALFHRSISITSIVPLSSSNALLHRSISITVSYHYPVPVPSYTDQYPLLCRNIIQFHSLGFRTGNILNFNVRSLQL